MGRLARPRARVGVLQGDDPTRAGHPGHLGDDRRGVRHVRKHEALVGDVEAGVRERERGGVPGDQADGVEPDADIPCFGKHGRVPLEPRHLAIRPDQLGQQRERSERAAAHVEHAEAGRDASALEQRDGARAQQRSLLLQPRALRGFGAEEVLLA